MTKITLTHSVDVKVEPNGLLIGNTLVTFGLLLADPEVVKALKNNLCVACRDNECSTRRCCDIVVGDFKPCQAEGTCTGTCPSATTQ